MLLAALRAGLGASGSGRFGFYGAFALAVTASVQLVGVYLVFSSLIIPALATRAHRGPRRMASPMRSAPPATRSGSALSALFDLPSGAVIVWTLAACALGFAGMRLHLLEP